MQISAVGNWMHVPKMNNNTLTAERTWEMQQIINWLCITDWMVLQERQTSNSLQKNGKGNNSVCVVSWNLASSRASILYVFNIFIFQAGSLGRWSFCLGSFTYEEWLEDLHMLNLGGKITTTAGAGYDLMGCCLQHLFHNVATCFGQDSG